MWVEIELLSDIGRIIFLFMLLTVPQGVVPSVVVGVVGIGHVEGITEYWDKEIDVKELLRYEKSYLFNSGQFSLRVILRLKESERKTLLN